MQKFGWVAAVVVAVLLASVVLGGCAKKQAATDEPIKIGVVAPLTGSLQFEGSQQLNGVKMAVAEVNAGLAPVIVQQVAEIVSASTRTGPPSSWWSRTPTWPCAKRNYVLEIGRLVREGLSEELMKDESIKAAYLGGGKKAS